MKKLITILILLIIGGCAHDLQDKESQVKSIEPCGEHFNCERVLFLSTGGWYTTIHTSSKYHKGDTLKLTK